MFEVFSSVENSFQIKTNSWIIFLHLNRLDESKGSLCAKTSLI